MQGSSPAWNAIGAERDSVASSARPHPPSASGSRVPRPTLVNGTFPDVRVARPADPRNAAACCALQGLQRRPLEAGRPSQGRRTRLGANLKKEDQGKIRN